MAILAPTDAWRELVGRFERARAERRELLRSVAKIEAEWLHLKDVIGKDITAPYDDEADGSSAAAAPEVRLRRPGTLTAFVLNLIDESPHGITRQQLISAIKASEFADRHLNAPNSFYNILKRELDRGDLRDVGGRLYSPRAAPAEDEVAPDQGPRYWPDKISEILSTAEHGLTTADIKERLFGTEWWERYLSQPGIVYSALTRLEGKGQAKQNGERWFDIDIYRRIERGEIDFQLQPPQPEKLRIPDVVVQVIREAGQPLRTGEIVDRMRAIPGMDERLGPLANLAYTHISKMARSGLLTRVGDRLYDLPRQTVVPFNAKKGGQS